MDSMELKDGAGFTLFVGLASLSFKKGNNFIGFSCTVPIALIGFIFLPGTPDNPSTRFLSAQEIELARSRMLSEKRQATQPLTLNIIKTVLRGWHFWILVIFAFFFSQADGVSSNSLSL